MLLKNVFITKLSKTFDFFGQKSKKKIIMFFSVLLYGITPSWSGNDQDMITSCEQMYKEHRTSSDS